ncbi:MAG: ATP-binding protein [Anaerolineaceae bacterium]|nr:ATP-binding protein [Anaerolineaceae bacterium]
MLHNLVIENYRLFKYFEVTSLARVNLIVGTNNSGKSSLLEAIHLLTSDDVRSSLIYLLNERGEYVSGTIDPRLERGTRGGYQVSHIFHERLQKFGQVIRISSNNNQNPNLKIALLESKDDHIPDPNQLSFFPDKDDVEIEIDEQFGYLNFEHSGFESESRVSMRLEADGLVFARPYSKTYLRRTSLPIGASKLITTNYLGYDELAVLWDKITLTPKEDKVVEALQILEPDVNRISFTSSQTSNSGILLRLNGQEEPIPLGSMGDGMRRILAIVASLVSVGKGTLLVDEIDTGLYYAVLKDMWRLILETAYKQNAQVFATTHSWDCVKAFQQALDEFQNSEFGRLIRLEKTDNQIKAVPYLADELSIAIKQDIEVR